MLSVMHLQAGGCGGCALELDLVALADAELASTGVPRHADILLVSGSPAPEMMRAVEAAWAEMAEPKWLVALGDCAISGGPFAGTYAGVAGLGARLPVSLAIPGNPPAPATILSALQAFCFGPAVATDEARAEPSATVPGAPAHPGHDAEQAVPRALLPAAPRHRLEGGGSSGR